MLRYCGIMAPNVEGAEPRAQDSPSDRSLVCPATQCMVIHLHCRLLQHPGYLQMSVGGVLIGKATFLRWRHETAWGGATKSLWRTRDRNYLPRHVKEWW